MVRRRQPFRVAPGTGLEAQARQRQEAAERKLSGLKAHETVRRNGAVRNTEPELPPRIQRDVEGLLAALGATPLYRIGNAEAVRVAPAYKALLGSAVQTINTGQSMAMLCWPAGQICLSGLVALLALAEVAAAPKKEFQKGGSTLTGRERPAGVRVALYPLC